VSEIGVNMIRTLVLVFAMAIVSHGIDLPIFSAATAQAAPSSPPTAEEQKKEWQDRYRDLLRNAARLERNALASRENYARAQRRNYPRGGARQQFIVDAELAEKQLVAFKAEIEGILDEARHAAIPPNWIHEVDEENFSYAPPASTTTEAGDEVADEDDREGRNPLYLKNEDAK
jgi:hypothetical protein